MASAWMPPGASSSQATGPQHLKAFLEPARRHADGSSLLVLMGRESGDFLTCEAPTHGFVRLRCVDCALERRQRVIQDLTPLAARVYV